jgi:hypothetical protein
MLTPQPSWEIKDATKIQSYMDCPRSYFFEYVLGWRPDSSNIHLEFGSAWHLAMEHLIVHGYDDVSILEAYTKLNTYYRQFFSEVLDEQYHPKTPAMALTALVKYCKEYAGEPFTPLFTEVAGSVSLTDKHTLSFRIDSILDTPDGIKSREHKTGSQLSRPWMDQWALKMQTGVYNHVLYCLFPRDKVWGVEINGAIFSKKDIKFQRVPARRTVEGMEAWYWNTINWCDRIDQDFQDLAICSPEDTVMRAFWQNTENCTKYFGCKYHDFCMAWGNPLSRCQEVPTGFKIEYWNPKAEEDDAKAVFRITDMEVTQER